MYRRMMGEPGTLWKRLWRVYRREERAPRRGRRAAGISVGTGCSVDMVAGAGKAQRRKQQEKRTDETEATRAAAHTTATLGVCQQQLRNCTHYVYTWTIWHVESGCGHAFLP